MDRRKIDERTIINVFEALLRESDEDMRTSDEEEVTNLDEVTPPGGEKVVKALKKQKGIRNPYAVAWSMKNKGDRFKR
jgi:hypothetical protein